MFLNFYGNFVSIEANSDQVLERLAKDFSFFISEKEIVELSTVFLQIKLFDDYCPFDFPQKQWVHSKNYDYIDYLGKRYLCLDGELKGEINFLNGSARFYSKDTHKLHEAVYLFVLSRLGKKFDILGLHKIHACALSKNGDTYLFPMVMTGGKSTLFLSLLSEADYKILADDAPLVTKEGRVLAFPLRVGLQSPEWYSCFKENQFYVLNRRRFGVKYLISLSDIKNSIDINSVENRIFLFNVFRKKKGDVTSGACYSVFLFGNIFLNMILGLGLPYAREFYFEGTWRDKITLVKIFLRRFFAAVALLRRAHCFNITLTYDRKKNAKYLTNFWSHNCR